MVQLSGHGSVEEQLKAAIPDWQRVLCDSFGRSAGQPSCLLVSAAALGAIAMIKSLPTFNKVRISSLCCCAHCLHCDRAGVQAVTAMHATMKLLQDV